MSHELDKLKQLQEYYNATDIPYEALDAAIRKGMRRKERKVWKNSVSVGISIVMVCLLLTLSIRSSTTFSNYMSQVPGLNKFVQLVKHDKGIVSALHNKYIQKINISDEHQGLKLTVDSIMIDQKRAILFYYYENKNKNSVELYPKKQSFKDSNGEDISASFGSENEKFTLKKGKSKLYKKIIDFSESNSLEAGIIYWTFEMSTKQENNSAKKKQATWQLPITYDISKIAKDKFMKVNQTINVAGQKIDVQSASVSPTRTDIVVSFPNTNSKQIFDLKGLKLEDNHGHSWSLGSDGLVSLNHTDNKKTYVFESNYYENVSHMYLSFDAIQALNKDELEIKVDPVHEKLLKSPKDGLLERVKYESGELHFYFKDEPEDFMIFENYTDANGKKHDLHEMSTSEKWIGVPYKITDNPVTHKPIKLKFTSYPALVKKHIKIQLY